MFRCQSIHVYISMSIKPVMHLSLPDVNRIFFLFSFNWIHLKLIHYFAKFARRKKGWKLNLAWFSPRQQIFELKSSTFRPRQFAEEFHQNLALVTLRYAQDLWRIIHVFQYGYTGATILSQQRGLSSSAVFMYTLKSIWLALK